MIFFVFPLFGPATKVLPGPPPPPSSLVATFFGRIILYLFAASLRKLIMLFSRLKTVETSFTTAIVAMTAEIAAVQTTLKGRPPKWA